MSASENKFKKKTKKKKPQSQDQGPRTVHCRRRTSRWGARYAPGKIHAVHLAGDPDVPPPALAARDAGTAARRQPPHPPCARREAQRCQQT